MARAAGSDSVVKLRGGRVFWNGVVLFGGDSVQAVAVFKGDGVALGLGLRAPIRSSSCLAAGFIRDGVVMFGGGTVQAVAVFKGDCVARGLGLRAQTRSSSCLAAGYNRNGVVTIGGGIVQAVAVFKGDCLVLGLWFEGLELGRRAAWRS